MEDPLRKMRSLDQVNLEHLARYHRALLLQPHLKPRTVQTKLWRVYTFLKAAGKDATIITRGDVEEWLLRRREEVQPVTLQGEILEVKLFYRWMEPGKEEVLLPGRIRHVRTELPMDRLLTRQDIVKLVEACTNQRDRALLMLLWDSAARIGEVMPLKIGDVAFDRYGAVVFVSGKTGRRRLRLTSSAPDLQAWVNIHPKRTDPEAPLWTTHRRYGSAVRALTLHTVEQTVKAIGRRAGIPGVHPHLIRHARLTDLVKSEGKRKGMNEMELRILAGWEKSSTMPAVYVHLSGGDVENRILQNAGLLDTGEEEEDTTLEPLKCPRCRAINVSGTLFCGKCSMALSERAIREIELLRAVDNDPDVLILVAEEMKKRRARGHRDGGGGDLPPLKGKSPAS